MKLKYTEEMIKSECIIKNAKFISIFTEKIKGKSRRMVSFKCNKHQDYGEQYITAEKLFSTNKICKVCNGKERKNTFKQEMYEINPNIEILSDFENVNENVLCRCLIHDYEWYGRPSVLLRGGGCKVCGKIKASKAIRKSLEDIKNALKIVNDNIYIIGDYKGYHEKIKCKCKIDGCEWESYVANILNNSAGCPVCASVKIKEKVAITHEEFCSRMKNKHKDISVVGKYIDMDTPIEFRCKKHDYYFKRMPRYFLYRDRRGCPKCNLTLGERKLYGILLNIFKENPKTQFKFDDCKDVHSLRFDAYIESKNIAFEYQGEQHYKIVHFNGLDNEQSKIDFEKGRKRDDIKREYCKNNNINLIEIPYWEYDNMEEYILEEIKKLKY